MSGSQSPNRTDEVMSENSQNRQSEPTREATPRPEQATHKVIENFMIKMTELLETSMATRRNEQVPVTGADEALERFLKFRPLEFYGDVEQEIKAGLFLEQLNDIYDTLKYEDALRVTFAAFRLRGMAMDWWLRASEARTLKNQPWTCNDFQEEFKKEYIPRWVREQREDEFQQLRQGNLTVAQYTAKFNRLAKYCLRLIDTDENKTRQFVKGLRVELQRALAPLPPMGFAAAVEAATRTEMASSGYTKENSHWFSYGSI